MTIVGFAPIVSASALLLTRLAELATKRDIVPGPVRENLTFRLFLLAGILMVAGSMTEYFLRDTTIFWPGFIAGWLCAVASFFIRRRAISALGKFWSLHVEIRDNHEFVRSGPFRWMRHPTYFSMILELLAVGLMLNARYSYLLLPLLFVPVLLMRLKLEESALVEKFGDAYRLYQQTTPAIFPIRWPRTK
jgi:isoprenylcysteine carboxyl methyltransferase (ICMT) family protein YpbQ